MGVLIVVSLPLWGLCGALFAAPALLAFFGRLLALARDALHSLHGHPAGPGDCRWPGGDRMDRIHRRAPALGGRSRAGLLEGCGGGFALRGRRLGVAQKLLLAALDLDHD